MALGQLQVAGKTNEISSIPLLLQLLDIKGATITLDALGCQKSITKLIRERQADYVLSLKGNHRYLHREAKLYLALLENQQLPIPYADVSRVEKDHGRIETREYWALDEVKSLGKSGWADISSIIMVKATREIAGKVSVEKRFYNLKLVS
ncbi:MAG: ISAs1 family transposase ISXa1 [Legionellaceae bacterium]